MKVLVTGGAGYIGSQVALDLQRAGHTAVVLDNLVKGHRAAVRTARLVVGDVGDFELVRRLVREEALEAVVHLAAYSLVGESVQDPGKYYRNNVGNGVRLLDALVESGVRRFVFSLTAATYGEPQRVPIAEDHPKEPTNPYGRSKLAFEGALRSYAEAFGLRYVALRYFNAAGADPDGAIGEDHTPETHLIPIVLQAALGQRPHVELFGSDYPTPDGTCVRDYIHVADLSSAHLLALGALADGAPSAVYNLGNGQGFSNRQVVDVARRVSGAAVAVVDGPRRPGDPAVLVASSARIASELGWRPRFPQLEDIVATAWRWHSSHPRGYAR